MKPKLKALFIIHAIFNLLGAALLIFAVAVLNRLLHTNSHSDFLWRLLGVCSLALAYLSYAACDFKDKQSINAVIKTILIFNGLAFVVSVWSVANGLPSYVFLNGAVHLVFFILFVTVGLRRANLSDL